MVAISKRIRRLGLSPAATAWLEKLVAAEQVDDWQVCVSPSKNVVKAILTSRGKPVGSFAAKTR